MDYYFFTFSVLIIISFLMILGLSFISNNVMGNNSYELFCAGHGMTWDSEYRVGNFCIDGNGLAHQIACNGSLCGFVVRGES